MNNLKDLFINKYYPKKIDDFEIDNDMKDSLKLLIEIDNLNILFVGNMCSGKTSLINVLINTYYDNDKETIDKNTLTINCLREQGINYYRNEVKTFCQTKGLVKNKKKIVILDDVDTINEQSQQVFRNCLDKYSNNVHFISSCNNIQKVIDSFQSRQIIIKLNKFTDNAMINIYDKIVSSEKIILDDDIKHFLIKNSANTPTILITYLEKIKLLGNVELDTVIENCSNININDFISYTELCLNKNLKDANKLLMKIYDRGFSVMDIFDNYFQFIKKTDLVCEETKYKIIELLCKYITIFHNIHEEEIELALFTNNLISSI